MTWPLYMDHHVPWAVTSALRRRGYEILTAHDDHASQFDDEALLNRATQLSRILVTHDDDFLSLAAARRRRGEPFWAIAYSRQQYLTDAELIEWLELIASVLSEDEVRNQVIYLPMR